MTTVSLVCEDCVTAVDVPLDKASNFRLCSACQKESDRAHALRVEQARKDYLNNPNRGFVHSATTIKVDGQIYSLFGPWHGR